MNTRIPPLGLGLAVALAACAGQQERPAPAPARAAVSKLAGLTHKQRVAFMKAEIMPRMTPIFQAFDPTRFARVTCVTCHGPGAEGDRFDMPTADLPRLDFSRKDPKKERWNRFMRGEVVPTMAAALGVEPFDKATRTGFGCLNCHLKAASQGGPGAAAP